AENLILKLELGAARQGLHADPAVPELAVSARLLLVPALDVGFAADGLAIRNLGSLQRHIHAVTFFKPADDYLDMLLAAAAQQKLFGLRIAIEPQRLIFLQNAMDGMAHAVFVRPRFGLNRKCYGGLGQLDRVVLD